MSTHSDRTVGGDRGTPPAAAVEGSSWVVQTDLLGLGIWVEILMVGLHAGLSFALRMPRLGTLQLLSVAFAILLLFLLRSPRCFGVIRYGLIANMLYVIGVGVVLGGPARGLLPIFYSAPIAAGLICGRGGLYLFTPIVAALVIELDDGQLGPWDLVEPPGVSIDTSWLMLFDLLSASLIVVFTTLIFILAYRRVLRATKRQTESIERQVGIRREAEAAAKRASEAKSGFLAVMSHEVRTPLNGIFGAADLLEDEPLGPTARSHLDVLRGCSKSLLVILNDILDFSKIEAGELRLEPSPTPLATELTACAELVRPAADDKALTLRVDLDPDLPPWVSVDPVRLRQVTLNLLTNAVKFTPKGRVELVARRRPASAPGADPWVEIGVRDTGVGISEEGQKRLFQPFAQAERSTARKYGGTGLGLAISRQLVELMGGQLEVRSRIGEGTELRFAIPAPLARPASIGERPRSRIPSLVVLVVDDNAVNRAVASKLLNRLGHEVHVAASGREALERVVEQTYDLVLMDVQMPEMDGLEATRRILALGLEVPVIGLSANALPEHVEAGRAAGMVDYVAKPVRRDDLDEVIRRHAARASSPSEVIDVSA